MKPAIILLAKALGQLLIEIYDTNNDRTTNNLLVAITDWLKMHS